MKRTLRNQDAVGMGVTEFVSIVGIAFDDSMGEEGARRPKGGQGRGQRVAPVTLRFDATYGRSLF
jgi:hypothetical protein